MSVSAYPRGLPRRSLAGYAVALATVAAITFILFRVQAGEISQTGQYARPFGVLYLLSVALIAGRWGSRQGLFALACSLLASKLFLMPPRYSFRFGSTSDIWEVGALCLVGIILTLALAEQRIASRRAHELLATVSLQQQELQAILDGMIDGLIVADLQGKILTMNPAALRLNGFASVEEAQRNMAEFLETFEVHDMNWRPVPPDQRPLARVLKGETFSSVELHIRRLDTGRFWDASYSGTQVFQDGVPILALLTVRDVTERRTMEQALQISEERLRLAVEEAQIGLWHWDLLGDQVLCSLQCKILFGLPLEEDITFDRFLEAIHPDDRERTRQEIADALRSRSRYNIKHRAIWPDGSVHWVASIGHGSYSADGHAMYMEGVAMAIPEKDAQTSTEISPAEIISTSLRTHHLPVPRSE